jgi:hypothetical protein
VRLSSSPSPLSAPVSAPVKVPGPGFMAAGNHWTLELAPAAGWAPAWRTPLLALVLVVSAALGLLLLGLLVNRQQQAWLLTELKASGAEGRGARAGGGWGERKGRGRRLACQSRRAQRRRSAAGPACLNPSPPFSPPHTRAQESNGALANEKRRMDVLLERQCAASWGGDGGMLRGGCLDARKGGGTAGATGGGRASGRRRRVRLASCTPVLAGWSRRQG